MEADMRLYGSLAIVAAMVFAATVVPAAAQEPALVSGEIINLDELEAGKITIKHGPIPSLGLSEDGKASDFRPRNKALFSTVKAGDKIRFTAERVNGELVVNRLEKQ
jgi:Cu(I)/Ag(I) efflux system periplasmic protein CusF